MKIEKISENQIRCTLTKNDLADRAIKISELAYGSEKAKSLFRDMMRQAHSELGFEADDIPLMIEAIPYREYVVLIITKVEDPEELDTKFSNFAPGMRENDMALEDIMNDLSNANEVLDLFKKIQDSVLPSSAAQKPEQDVSVSDTADDEEKENPELTRMFTFSTISHVNKLARLAGSTYRGSNSLYKDESYGTYILIVNRGPHSKVEYNKFCNMASEYGSMHKPRTATEHFLVEHFEPLIKDTALQTLSEL